MSQRNSSLNFSCQNSKCFKQRQDKKLNLQTSLQIKTFNSKQKDNKYCKKCRTSISKTSIKKQKSPKKQTISKISQTNQIVQYDNMKWISIIAAYDPKSLKSITIATKPCVKFLKAEGENIKTDFRSTLYFNDLIKNFKAWLSKIQLQCASIIGQFVKLKKYVNMTLLSSHPKLSEVVSYARMMEQKLQDCLKAYQNLQFRELIKKYKMYLQNSKLIFKIIMIVHKSNAKIQKLFQKCSGNNINIYARVMQVGNKGIEKASNMAYRIKGSRLSSIIINLIQIAINQMTQKPGQVYKKIWGIQQLIKKFKRTQYQSDQVISSLNINTIKLICKVCKELCFQANDFEQFVQRFLQQGDRINDDLRRLIQKYLKILQVQRKKAIMIQIKFLEIIFNQTIKKLKKYQTITFLIQNEEQNWEQFKKILIMIQDISKCLVNKNKISIQRFIKEIENLFNQLYSQLKYLKQIQQTKYVDTQQGLVSIQNTIQHIKKCKQIVQQIKAKFLAYQKQLQLPIFKNDQTSPDEEAYFINQTLSLSKKIINTKLKQRVDQAECFSNPTRLGLKEMTIQIQNVAIVEYLTETYAQFKDLQSKSILKRLFGSIRLQNKIFEQASIMIKLIQISNKTNEINLTVQLEQAFKKQNYWMDKHTQTSIEFKRFFNKILAKILYKGLSKEDVDQIDDPEKINFPVQKAEIQIIQTKFRNRKIILDLIQKCSNNNNNLKLPRQEQDTNRSSAFKSKYQFTVSIIIQQNIAVLKDVVDTFHKLQQTKLIQSQTSCISKQDIFSFCQQLFQLVFRVDQSNYQKILNLLKYFIRTCQEKIEILRKNILDAERNLKQSNNSSISKIKTLIKGAFQNLKFKKSKNENLLRSLIEILEKLCNYIGHHTQSKQKQFKSHFVLNLYKRIISLFVNFLRDTNQKALIILDKRKSPIAILNPKQKNQKKIYLIFKYSKKLSPDQILKLILQSNKVENQSEDIFKGRDQEDDNSQVDQIEDIHSSDQSDEQIGENQSSSTVIIYRIINFVSNVSDLKRIIKFIDQIKQNYFIDRLNWQKIEQYYNDHYSNINKLQKTNPLQSELKSKFIQKESNQKKQRIQSYVNQLQNDLQNLIKQSFKQKEIIVAQLRKNQQIKNIELIITGLKSLNWQILQQVLHQYNISYNILKNPFHNQNLSISIDHRKSQKKYDQYGCIDEYLTRCFKFYRRDLFDLESYVNKCFNKQTFQYNQLKNKTIVYTIKQLQVLIKNPAQTQKKFIIINKKLSQNQKTTFDIYNFCISLYKKSLKIIQKIEINIKQPIQQVDISQKDPIQQNSLLFYMKSMNYNSRNNVKNSKQIKSKLQNIASKCSKQNIFQCIQELNSLFGQQIKQTITLANGNHNNIALIVDKLPYEQNIQPINQTISSKQNQKQDVVQKIILALLSCQQILDKQNIIESDKCIQNIQRITKIQQIKIMIKIFQLFRINHSYILIQENGVLKYFTLGQSKEICITNYLKKNIQHLKDKLNSDKFKKIPYFQSLSSLLNSSQPNFYKIIFEESQIDKLFKQRINQSTLVVQTLIIVDRKKFSCQQKLLNENFLDQVMELIQNQTKEINQLLNQIHSNSLNPCQYIYEKYIAGQRKQHKNKWQAHVRNLKKLQDKANKLFNTNCWLVYIKQIQSKLKHGVIDNCQLNSNSISKIIDSTKSINTFSQILKQINQTYQWVKKLNENNIKKNLTLYTLKQQEQNKQTILFFDFNQQSFKKQHFKNYFSFIKPNNEKLFNILFGFITSSSHLQTNYDKKSKYQLSNQDKLYRISSETLSNSFNSLLEYICGDQYTKIRSAIIRNFVKTFNKIRFDSKTRKSLDFKQQIKNLYNIEQDLRASINQLHKAYYVRNFLKQYFQIFNKNEPLKRAVQFIEKLQKNERILEDDIPNIYKDLDKIKITKDMNKLSSYNQFISWFLNTVKKMLGLPFYSVVANSCFKNNIRSTQNQLQFLAVIITENPSDTSQNDNQLEQALKQMLLFSQHKEIYLKNNNLTVQLTKQPVFIQFQNFNEITSIEMINYLQKNKESEEQMIEQWCIRVEMIVNDDSKQRILLKVIALKQFLICQQQQFNIPIHKETLTVDISISLEKIQKKIESIELQNKLASQKGIAEQKLDTQKNYENFQQVYIGKQLKLKKLTQCIFNIYNRKINQDQLLSKKNEQLYRFYKQFVKQLRKNQEEDQQKILNLILSKIRVEQLVKSKINQPLKKPSLKSSLNIIQHSKKIFNQQKDKIYKQKENYKEIYDKYIQCLCINLQHAIIGELLEIQKRIKRSMEQQLISEYKTYALLMQSGYEFQMQIKYEQTQICRDDQFMSQLVQIMHNVNEEGQQQLIYIFNYFNVKHPIQQNLHQKIIQRIDTILEDYKTIDATQNQYILKPINKAIFLYLLLKQNQTDYVTLFAQQVQKHLQKTQQKQYSTSTSSE